MALFLYVVDFDTVSRLIFCAFLPFVFFLATLFLQFLLEIAIFAFVEQSNSDYDWNINTTNIA